MNKERTLALIHQQFTEVSSVCPDVVRAERRHNQAQIGVFFFDLSEGVAKADFNLADYMQRHIATDFYKHEGSLQWNYYLYFVLGKQVYHAFLKTGAVAKLEADRTFARKFVRDDDLLEQELSKPLAEAVKLGTRTKDIAAEWTQELSRAGLSDISDPKTAYTRIVDRFLSSPSQAGTKPPSDKLPSQSFGGVNPGKFIRYLHLATFRPFPSLREYDFGTVNLIRGANGSGKTSLLEAIELSICGGILRQDGGRPDAARIEIKFEGDLQAQRCPQDSQPSYRMRDLAWYGGYYRTGNQLHRNFGRFNFFDTDAAFRLSSADTREEVQKAIQTLFLGELANTLEERMQACRERFEKEERDYRRQAQSAKLDVLKFTSELKSLSAIRDTRMSLTEELNKHAVQLGWKKTPKQLNSDELVALQGDVDDLCSRLRDFYGQLKWMPRVTVSLLGQEAAQLKKANADFEAGVTQSEKAHDTIEKLKERSALANARLELMRRICNYHDETDGFSLRGLGKSITASKTRLAALEDAVRLLRDVETTAIVTSNQKLHELIEAHTAQLKAQERASAEARKRHEKMRAQIGAARALLGQIKTLGKAFCDSNPQATICPLCEAEYAKGELLMRLKKLASDATDDSQLRELSDELAKAEAALQLLQRNVHDLNLIREAAGLILNQSALERMSAAAIARKLSAATDDAAEVKQQLAKLIQTQKRLKLRGFTEEEISELMDDAKEAGDIALSILENGAALRRTISEREKQLDKVAGEIRDQEKLVKSIEADLQRITKNSLGKAGLEADEAMVEMHRRLDLVTETLCAIRQTKSFVAREDEEFVSITNRLKTFGDVVVRVEAALKRVQEKDALEKGVTASLQAGQSKLTISSQRLDKAAEALGVLNRLLKVENKSAYLNEIVQQHREKLVAIFTRIHAPNDFADVELTGDILLRRHGGVNSSVSQISTGQRAALALSIFLSLNSGVADRAPWLLFDDPVVHVDDLNTLSFFDSLRDLVLLGNRQVFFATANTRIANLFARKFDFLGSDFREFSLERAAVDKGLQG